MIGAVHGQGPTPTLYLSPANRTLAPQYTLLTFNVSVSNIPADTPLGGWDILVVVDTHDYSILRPVSITLFEDFGGTVAELTHCISGVIEQGCDASDGAGVAHSAATSFTSPPSPVFPTGNVTLFSVTYNATGASGYTSISLEQDYGGGSPPPALLSQPGGLGVPINVNVQGAIYGNAALAPVAAFSWSPDSPYQYEAVTVNASLSHAFGGATITNYFWPSKTTTQNVTTLVFRTPGNQSVSLIVRDSKGRLSLPVTHFIFVRQKSTIDLGLLGLSASEYNYIHAGDKIQLTATVFNNGTTTVKDFNVTLSLDNQVIATLQNTGNVTLNQYANLKYTWDTTNLKPSSYTLAATVTQLPGDNNTSDKYLSIDIRVIEFQGSTLLGVGLVPFGGILTIVIIGGGFAIYTLTQRSSRKRRAQQEAL